MSNYNIDITVDDFNNLTASQQNKTIEDLYKELDVNTEKYETNSIYEPLPDIDLEDKLELERLVFEEKTEEQLRAEAETLEKNNLDEEIAKIEDDTYVDNLALEKKLESEELDKQMAIEKTENDYVGKIDSANDSAIKNGLSRSSIIMNQVSNIENNKSIDIGYIEQEAMIQIKYLQNMIDFNINTLDTAKANYDSDLQKLVEERLITLLSDQQAEYDKVVKYNNELDIEEAEYLINKNDAINDRESVEMKRLETLSEYGGEYFRQEYMRTQLETAREYFNTLDAKTAYDLIKDNAVLQEKLGAYYSFILKEAEGRL